MLVSVNSSTGKLYFQCWLSILLELSCTASFDQVVRFGFGDEASKRPGCLANVLRSPVETTIRSGHKDVRQIL